MFTFFKNVKKAADFFNNYPERVSFVTERRLKDLETNVNRLPKAIEDKDFHRFIRLEHEIDKLKETLKSSQTTKTAKKPKAVKFQAVEEKVKKVKSELTQTEAKRLFEYRDGELYWKVDRIRVKKGDKAGTTKGYKYVFIDGWNYPVAQVIFLMFHGYMPENVSCIDGKPQNTKIENLRPANKSQLKCHSKKYKNNTTGFKGVSAYREKYQAQITKLGKHYHLGCFDTPEKAHKAYCKAAKKLHGQFARTA